MNKADREDLKRRIIANEAERAYASLCETILDYKELYDLIGGNTALLKTPKLAKVLNSLPDGWQERPNEELIPIFIEIHNGLEERSNEAN